MKILRFSSFVLLLLSGGVALPSRAAITDLASAPLVTSSSSSVFPNIMFVLDDSGSMNWDFLPDWACGSNSSMNSSCQSTAEDSSVRVPDYLFMNPDFNGLAYNPAVTYLPPAYFNSDGTVNTARYPSQTAANTSSWTAVKNDGYGVQSSGTSSLVNNAYFYTTVVGEFCSNAAMRSCSTQSSTSYPVAAKLRWCNSSSLANCQASFNSLSGYSYTYFRSPSPTTATLSIGGTSSTSISSITVNGREILSAAAGPSTSAGALATTVGNNINACSNRLTGSCAVTGYVATVSGSVITLRSPDGNTYTPVVSKSGSMTATVSAFAMAAVPGYVLRTTITSTTTDYPFPGTTAKAVTRTDCAGANCTYAEEMTNYANWWAYYRTRMQMMKTAASLAFASLGSSYRVGYLSINSNAGGYIKLDQFGAANKQAWYDRFFAASPGNGTPLRAALVAVGRYYAGKTPTYTSPASRVSTSLTDDPIQYSCQQNFTILSTDGYWNESPTPKQLDGSTAVGNQDGGESRPYYDGASATYSQSTSQLQESRYQTFQSTSQLLKSTTTTTNATATLIVTASSNNATLSAITINGANRLSGTVTASGSSASAVVSSIVSAGLTGGFEVASSGSCAGSGNPVSGCVRNGAYLVIMAPAGSGSVTWSMGTTSSSSIRTTTSSFSGGSAATSSVSSAPAASCTAGVTYSGNTRTVTACPGYTTTGPTLVDSCVTQTASAGNNYTQTLCSPVTIEAATGVSSCTPDAASSINNHITTACTTATTGPTTVTSCTPQTASANNGWLSVVCANPVFSGGTSNTLADTAEYYYTTDLRTSALGNCSVSVTSGGTTTANNVCDNNVPRSGSDAASWQHMTTFTLGLGASGLMQYSASYAASTSGDFYDVKQGSAANPSQGICTWQSNGSCNWPVPTSNTQTTIDDLWHAAVNGRGTFYSATNPASLVTGLSSALAGVSARTGSSSAASISNPNIVAGDNFVFSSTFTSQNWDGELVRRQMNLLNGDVSSTIDWSAQSKLDANTGRTIYTYDNSASNKLKIFNWTTLNSTEQSYFTLPAIATLSQFCTAGTTCLSSTVQTAAAGSNLVAYLRGDRTNEGPASDTSKYYRQRSHVLGDVVNAEAVYVKKSLFSYADYGYLDFVSTTANRQGMVYVAANDGMLHAFYAADGSGGIVGGGEAWAYIPSLVLPNLFKLADKAYANQHQYFVDGTPAVSDICVSNCATPSVTDLSAASAVWKTILVGGFGGGGRGYYALDITDPASPKALWEYGDADMGYTYGNPEITKLKNGTWVVLVASGYNNISPGDGVGRLYVLNAYTGELIRTISTGVGSTVTPSGLARIRAWVDNAMSDNTVQRVYGGDILGNLWRFDVNGDIGADGYDAQLLATLKDGSNNPQPITAKPELGQYGGNALIFIGTGRYLGASDLSDVTQQSMYGIKDSLGTASYGNPRTSTAGSFVQQTVTTTVCPAGAPSSICVAGEVVRASSNNNVNYALDSGWYFDFPIAGERANTDPVLALGTLTFTTNVPNSNACNVGGESYLYYLDYRTGGLVSTAGGVVGIKLGNTLATRPVVAKSTSNTVFVLIQVGVGSSDSTAGAGGGSGGSGSSDGHSLQNHGLPIGSSAGTTRRVSWRELINE